MIPITCQSCGYANEPTRVFCHQCAVRLERPADEPKAEEKKPPVSRPLRRRPVIAKTEPRSVSIIASVIKIAIFAAIWAMFLLALRAPANLPTLASPNPEQSRALQERYLEASKPSPFPHTLVMTGEELNGLLATEVSIKQTGFIQLAAGEPRPFIVLQPQAFTLGMAIPVLGQQLVFQNEFAVNDRKPGDLSLRLTKSQVGRLPVAPFVMDKVIRWHHAFGAAFAAQLQKIQKANQVLIGSENVQITWPADS